MSLVTSSTASASKSRLVGIRLSMLTLRLMENWRRVFKDNESAIIALAIVAIVSEKLMRVELSREQESLAKPMPLESLARCNISSIAAATGLNRETTRRKINQLVEAGIVVREGGSVSLTPGSTQQQLSMEVVQSQLEELRRAANDLIRAGAMAEESSPHG